MSSPAIFFVRLERQEKAVHVCRLAEKYFQRGQRILIVVANNDMATTLDRYLWTWKKGSFLPHGVISSASVSLNEAIVISTGEHNANKADVLICAAPCSSSFFKEFQVVFDFAETYDPQLADSARQRFRLYREQGFDPQLAPAIEGSTP